MSGEYLRLANGDYKDLEWDIAMSAAQDEVDADRIILEEWIAGLPAEEQVK